MASVIRFLVASAVAVVASASELEDRLAASQLARILVGDVSPTVPLPNETITSTTATATTTTFTTTLPGGGDPPSSPSPAPSDLPSAGKPTKPTPEPEPETSAPVSTAPQEDSFIVKVSANLAVENATAACADEGLGEAVQKTLTADVPADNLKSVEMKCLPFKARRLEGRRAAEQEVTFTIEIEVTDENVANEAETKISNINATQFTESVNNNLPEGSPFQDQVVFLGMTTTVQIFRAPTEAPESESPSEETTQEPSSDDKDDKDSVPGDEVDDSHAAVLAAPALPAALAAAVAAAWAA